MTNQPKIVTVVVTMDREADLAMCLRSLAASDYANHEALVCEPPGHMTALPPDLGALGVTRVTLSGNNGYAGNNNEGIRAALRRDAAWVLVLNDDTWLAADALAQLIGEGESQPDIGMVGPLIYHADRPNVIQSAGGELGRRWRARHIGFDEAEAGQYREARDVEWLSGSALLARRALIEQAGAFDDRLFIYWEETDWCLRARARGWRLRHVPGARAWHRGGQTLHDERPGMLYLMTRNRLMILAKHRAPLAAWATAWAETGRTLAAWSLRPRWRHKRPLRNAMWQGVWDFWRGRTGPPPRLTTLG